MQFLPKCNQPRRGTVGAIARKTQSCLFLAILVGFVGAPASSAGQDSFPESAQELSGAPQAPLETILHNFCIQAKCADGSAPYSPLIMDKAGNMYGTTEFGGTNGAGAVFMLHPSGSGWKETVLYSFCSLTNCADGEEPTAGLTLDSSGILYGTTSNGGTYCPFDQSQQCGVVFKLSQSNGVWSEIVVHAFGGTNTFDGGFPVGALALDASGNLYGATFEGGDPTACSSFGCGVVYELEPSGGGWTETILHYFALEGATDGIFPSSGVTRDGSGNLFGTTSACSSTCQGIVYKLANGTWKETILHNFAGGTDGAQPRGDVALDSSGNIYGTAYSGGSGKYGLAFKLGPKGKETILHNFRGAPDGKSPLSGLTVDSAGNVYGTTLSGGTSTACSNGCGTFFWLSSSQSWKETVFSFGAKKGSSPESGVLYSNGVVYGSASSSGANNGGVVYKIVP